MKQSVNWLICCFLIIFTACDHHINYDRSRELIRYAVMEGDILMLKEQSLKFKSRPDFWERDFVNGLLYNSLSRDDVESLKVIMDHAGIGHDYKIMTNSLLDTASAMNAHKCLRFLASIRAMD